MKRVLLVHSSKFKLAFHPWDESLKQVAMINEEKYHLPLVTRKIGKIVYLNDATWVLKNGGKGWSMETTMWAHPSLPRHF